MKMLHFWWTYLTNASFRGYVHMHDKQKFLNEIENMRRDQLEHESRRIWAQNYPITKP